MKTDWLDLGPVDGFPEAQPVLRRLGELRLVCVRTGDDVHALDDRCPHQGYPLSQGCVNGNLLTCQWHNWKFELTTGQCVFGGEPVRRYRTRVSQGQVFVDPAVDLEQERVRLVAGLRAALADDSPQRALREALRLDALSPRAGGSASFRDGFALLARDGAERAEYGFDHPLALLADVCSWVDRQWLEAGEAFVMAAAAIAERSHHLPLRAVAEQQVPHLDEPARVAEALTAERREEAEVRVRQLVRDRGAAATVQEALMPFVTRHILDYGHGLIFLSKALELALRFPEVAEPVLVASVVELGWATAETALPPFTATRQAVERLQREPPSPRGAGFAREQLESAVLAGERSALEATWSALAAGCDPLALLRVIGHAAAVRLARFDRAWERRIDAEVGVLDVSHAVTFTEAAISLAAGSSPEHAARLALLAAGFVGKLRRGDAPSPTTTAVKARYATLTDAARARDLDAALALADQLSAAERNLAYQQLAPFAALESAVRPIFYAHSVKTCEALRRLEAADSGADGTYLRALLALIVPTPSERNFRRSAAVARKFFADGRPPEGLY